MDITFKRQELADALSALSQAIASKGYGTAYRCVHLKMDGPHAVLTASDTEVTISIRLDVRCEKEKRGVIFLIPHDKFSQIARMATGEDLSISSSADDSSKVTIQCGGGEWTLQLEDSDSFAVPKMEKAERCGHVSAANLRDAFSKVVFACDPTSTRYAFGGVYLDPEDSTLNLVATDSRRMAVANVDVALGNSLTSVVVPVKGVRSVMSAITDGDITVGWSSHLAIFQNSRAMVITRLVEWRFPQYRHVIPTSFDHKIEIPRQALLSAVRQAMIVTNEESRGVELAFSPSDLRVTGAGQDIGKSCITVPISGDADEVIAIDPRYVVEALKAMQAETVSLKFSNSESPVVIEEPGNLQVIMPLAKE